MPLNPGEQLGHYRIQSLIGRGGMGEVYKAFDTKLDRDVAIKVLPAAWASDPERLARFEREAKVLAQLNHSGIASIYGLEGRALVMEMVPGPTLAERIAQGPIPAVEAEEILLQIAEAFEYAHERGIVHRDLKPANIKIDPEDKVKILDFGLAKALYDPTTSTGGDPSESPTITMGGTLAGTILGTAAYMAPEQARGKKVDRRADIWAFGVVVWEMLTGERLFKGEDTVQVLGRVLEQPVDLERAPAKFRKLLARSLDRNVKDRLRDIGEARFLLREPEGGSGDPPQAESLPHSKRAITAVAAVATVAAMGLGFVAFRHAAEEPPRLVKVSVLPPEKSTILAHSLMAVSPDGRRLAFVAATGGKTELWVRDLDALAARLLPGTEGARDPFWSPDSRTVAFFVDRKLKRIDVAGGPAVSLCDVAGGPGGSWSQSGVILIGGTRGATLRVPDTGGTPTPVTELDRATGELAHRSPWFLPDGHRFLYTVMNPSPEKGGVFVGDIEAKSGVQNRQPVVPANSNAVYVPPGYLLFVREGTLMAQPFDPAKARPTGDAIPIAEQIDSLGDFSAQYQFSASQNGILAYTSGSGFEGHRLTWADRSGKMTDAVGPPGAYNNFRLAPDEKRIAFDRPDAQSGIPDVWVMDLIRGTTSRLTFDPTVDNIPIWSPDGLRILYPNRRSGVFDLYIKAASGAGQEEVLVKMGTPTGWGTHWSRDGRFVMYEMPGAKTGEDLWVAPQFGDRKPFPYLQSQFNESEGTFSPDGRWVAYVSNESGRNEIYVQAFPLSGAKFQISTGGGTEPGWRRDGAELFYLAADRNLMAVPVKSGATLEAGVPKPLFPIAVTAGRHSYAAANDGQRFLVAAGQSDEKSVPVNVVLNWQAGLKK